MNNTLWWLAATLLMTVLLWLPYVLDRIAAQGVMGAMGYDPTLPPGSEWGHRAKQAHANAIENIAVFAPLVVVHHLANSGGEDPAVTTAVMIYFIARLLHYLVFAAKVPVLRTLTFFAGWGATVFVALRVLGVA